MNPSNNQQQQGGGFLSSPMAQQVLKQRLAQPGMQQPQQQGQGGDKGQKGQMPQGALSKIAGVDKNTGQPQTLGQMSYLAIKDAVSKGWIRNGEDLHKFILNHPTASRAATSVLANVLGLHIFQ